MEALEREYRGDIPGAQKALRRAGAVLAQAVPPAIAQAFSAELTDMEEEIGAGLSKQASKIKHYAAYRTQRSRKDYKK
jgi:hypothetical protein